MQLLGKYEIKGKLGAGGFGQVFRALDPTMGRMVAIKLLTASDEPDTLRRFRNEASAAGNLRHKNIVTVHEFGEQDGVPYIVMEFMDGEDLQRVISKHRPLTILQKVRILMEIAEGLHHAHENGILHRDVKPANIMLLNNGSVKIMDFGIALVTQDTGSRLTPQGSMLGTFRYMAPEQFHGTSADRLSEIFSYGIIFYELLCGVHPFHAQEPAAVMLNITLREPTPVRSLVPECSEALEAIAVRLLSKSRDQRYLSLEDVHYDLAAIRLELESDNATATLAQARQLVIDGDLPGAQLLVRKVLDVNPTHREARELRESLQRKLTGSRAETPAAGGREESTGHRFETMPSSEATPKMDRTKPYDRPGTLWERGQTVARMLGEARAAFENGHYAAARDRVEELLRLDPSNQEASELLKTIDAKTKSIELQQRLQSELAAATDMLGHSRFEEAVRKLETLHAEFPAEEQVAQLYQRSRSEWEADLRVKAVEEVTQSVESLRATNDFAGALSRLDEGLTRFPLDGGLIGLKDRLLVEQSLYERQQGIEAALHQCQELENQERFADAIQACEYAISQYGPERPLDHLNLKLKERLDTQRRTEGVAKAAAEAHRLVNSGSPEIAIPLLQDALANYPRERELAGLLSLAAQECARTIQDIRREAAGRAHAHDFERAFAVVEQGLSRFPGESSLLDQLAGLNTDKAISDSSRFAADERFEEAVHVLTEFSKSQDQPDERIARALGQVQTDWQAHQVRAAVAKAVADAGNLLERGQPAEALEFLNEMQARYPGERELEQLAARAEQAFAQQERANHVSDLEGQIQRLAQQKKLEEALRLAEQALQQFAGEPILVDLQQRLEREWQQWQRSKAVASAVAEMTALLERGRLDDALRFLDEATARYPGEAAFPPIRAKIKAEIEARQRAENVEKSLSGAQAYKAQRNFDRALAVLDQGLKLYPNEPALVDERRSTVLAKNAYESIQKISAFLDANRLEEAQQLLTNLLTAHPSDPELQALALRAEKLRKARERNVAIERLTTEARARTEARDFDGGLTILDSALTQYPDEPILTRARQAAVTAKTQWEEEERHRNARAADVAELQQLALTVRQTSWPSDFDKILKKVRKIAGKHASDGDIQAISTALIEQLSSIQDADRALSNQDLAGALAICTKFLQAYPDHAAFASLNSEVLSRQHRLDTENLLRQAAAETNLDERVRLLSEGLKQYPGEAAVAQQFQVARNKLGLANSIRAAVDAHELNGEWDQALAELARLAAVEEGFAGLDAHIKRVQGKREAARLAAIAEWTRQVDERTKAGDLAAAEQLLAQAFAAFPEAEPLKQSAARLAEVKQRQAKARELLSRAQSALNSDWRAAEGLVRDALTLDGSLEVPKKLAAAIAEKKRNDAIAAHLAKAGQHRKSGDWKEALRELDLGLKDYPSEARLKAEQAAVDKELRAWRANLIGQLQSLKQAAQSASSSLALEPLFGSAHVILTQSKLDDEVKAAVEATLHELTARRRQMKNAHLWALLASRRKQLGYAGATVVVGAAAIFGIREFTKGPTLIPLAFSAAQQGAIVNAGGESCTAPCTLNLKPGSYSVEAHLDGYEPAIQRMVLTATSHQPVNFSLTPLPLEVRVATDFPSGSVLLDGKIAGTLKNGQFSLDRVPFGQHDLSVTGPDGSARVKFQMAEGKPPTFIGAVTARDSDAVAIGNLGKVAKLSSTRLNEGVTVDGKASGAISESGLELRDLPEGNRDLKIGQHPLVMSVRKEPSLTLVVTSDRNVGSLIVEALPEENATVTSNGKTIGQTSHGILRIPLEAAERPYSVRIEKRGFVVQPPELSVRIRKGEEFKAAFRLEAIPQVSKLTVSGGEPGARVLVDGASVGAVGPNGSLSIDVKPGDHDIEMNKDGYSPKRLRKTFVAGGEITLAKPDSELTISAPDPRKGEDQDWERIRASKHASDFDDFVRSHPSGAHAGEARSRSAQIAQQARADAASLAEQTAWDTTDKGNKAALLAFLSRFGTGAHAQQARGAIAGLDKQEADALAAAQLATERKNKKENDQAQVNAAAAEQRSITQTVSEFEAAYNRRDLGAMQTLWAGMSKSASTAYRDQFGFAKAIVFRLQPSESASVNGDSATVNCTRSLSLTLKSGPAPPPVNERVRVTLRRAPASWVIQTITPY